MTNLTTVGQTVTLYAQWKEVCPSGNICYRKNGDDVVGTMGQQSVGASDTSITLLASNFSREDYGFAGWSDVEDYATNPNAHFYGPQEDLTFTAGTYTSPNNGLDLYAIWIASEGYLQDSTKVATLCGTGTGSLDADPADGTATLSSVSALTDQRDNETYAIAKLADGKCWMIENLRLENTASHNTDGSLAQSYNTSFIGLADPESANFIYSTTANSLYSIDGSTDATISGNYKDLRFPRYNNYNNQSDPTNRPQSPTTNSSRNSTTNAGMYSYGNYYTWAAAIADTTHYSTNNQSITNTSLCPAGWHLPKGGDNQNTANNEYLAFTEALTGAKPANYAQTQPYYTGTPEGTDASNALRSFPNNFLYSGYLSTSTAFGRGEDGFYWSSTSYDQASSTTYGGSYILFLASSSVYPGTDHMYSKYYGGSIRCVAPGS